MTEKRLVRGAGAVASPSSNLEHQPLTVCPRNLDAESSSGKTLEGVTRVAILGLSPKGTAQR